MTQDPYHVVPEQISPQQERQWGMIAHLAPLVAMVFSAGTLGFVGSNSIAESWSLKGVRVTTGATIVNVRVGSKAPF